MREAFGDIWDAGADAIVIPTNGSLTTAGLAVMGAGIARQAADRYPLLPRLLGEHLKHAGNTAAHLLTITPGNDLLPGQSLAHAFDIWTLPTKHVWNHVADRCLIVDGCRHLLAIADKAEQWCYNRPLKVALPRVGCGLGGLRWAVVKEDIKSILDDRFTVYHWVPAKR